MNRAGVILLLMVLVSGCQMPSRFEGQTQIIQNGQVRAEGHYENGSRDGVWTYYDALGNVQGQGTYENSKMKSGLEITFYHNGHKEAEGTWTNGQKDGYWIAYFRSGTKQEEGNYLHGKKTGVWREYDPSFFYALEKVFEDGKLVGLMMILLCERSLFV
jgi:antitoxin component YwqK of YwqJK toxin-antitoxin module